MLDWSGMLPEKAEGAREPEPEPEHQVADTPVAESVPVAVPVVQPIGQEVQHYPASPAAVVLLLACHAYRQQGDEAVSRDLVALRDWPPSEQVRYWQAQCRLHSLNPWPLIYLPAPKAGADCCSCRHLQSQCYPAKHGRRQFHWCCGQGYQIHEYSDGSERIWCAPPECQSFERWYPAMHGRRAAA